MALEQQHQQLRHTSHLFLQQKSAGCLVMNSLMDSPTGVENSSLKMALQFVGCQAELENCEVY